MFRLGSDAQPSREDQQRWMVRDEKDGDVLYFSGFDTLHRWIVEREVDRTWQISRTGDSWTMLGNIGEFRPIFQVVDNVSSLESNKAVARDSEPSEADGGRKKKSTLKQFHGQGGGQSQASPRSSTPAPTKADSPSGERANVSDSQTTQPVRNRRRSSSQKHEVQGREPKPSPAQQPAEPATTQPTNRAPERPEEPRRRTQSSEGPTAVEGPNVSNNQADASVSDVQLDSGMFGSQREPEPTTEPDGSDEWSFGDEDVPLDQTDDFDDTTVAYESGGGGGGRSIVLPIVLVMILGGGAYLWFFQRSMVQSWLGEATGEAETVDLDEKTDETEEKSAEAEEESEAKADGKPPVVRSREVVTSALQSSTSAAAEEAATYVKEAKTEAAKGIVAGLDAAGKKAKEAAEEPKQRSVNAVLADAQNALERGRTNQARKLFHRVIDRDGRNSEAITGLGWALLNMGHASSAQAQFKKALHYNPSFGDAYIGLGHANRELGNLKPALDAYQKYLDRFPGGSKASIAKYQAEQLKKQLGVN